MRIGQFNKQPGERESFTITYEDALTAGDNVQAATASVTPAGLLLEQITVLDPRVKFYAKGGTSGVTYKVTFDVTTVDGRVIQDEVLIKVKVL